MSKISEKTDKEKLLAEIERLKKELKKRKKYGLVWEEKPEDVVEMCKEKLPVLKEVKDKEIITNKDKPVNLLIEGDNYHALSVLNYTHAKKVDVIYIDPPYNTGKKKEWKFNDHWVDKEDVYRHSKWLSFMEKRLKLARNLLKDTGVIFISIDDNEIAQLRLLCSEIFRENNALPIFTRVTKKSSSSGNYFSPSTDYILSYSVIENSPLYFFISLTEEQKHRYNKKDKNGLYQEIGLYQAALKHGGSRYPITCPDGTRVITPNNIPWRWNEKTFLVAKKEDKIVFKKTKKSPLINYITGKKATWNIYTKLYLQERLKVGLTPKNFNDTFQNTLGSQELKRLGIKFEFPKPTNLIKFLLSFFPRNITVLDFFAGSGTTAHAVLSLNKQDGGDRKFVLCTNNENNICTDVCYPRINKVIEGYTDLRGRKVEGLGGNLKYFKTAFVDAEPTDRNKIKLTKQATEMLCVKEGTFEKVLDQKSFKIFKNVNHYTGIIFDQVAIPAFKKAIKDIKGRFSVYVFSLGDDIFEEEFSDVKQKVKLSPIPEAILRVYRRIFR